MLPDSSVSLSDKVATRRITPAQNILAFILNFTQGYVTCRCCVLLSLALATANPITPWHITSQDQTICISIVMSLVQLLDKFFALLENFIVIGRPDGSIKLGGEGGGTVRRVTVTEGDPVIVNSRVQENAAIALFFSKIDLVLRLIGY